MNDQIARFRSMACVADDVRMGERVRLAPFVNLYGCEIGDDTRLGAFVEVQRDAKIGRRCKISSHTFICSGVTIEDEVFIGHGVIFINDRYPRATTADGAPQTESDWKMEDTVVRNGASIGSGAIIMCGVEIGAARDGRRRRDGRRTTCRRARSSRAIRRACAGYARRTRSRSNREESHNAN